ncbi:MAG: hypothetical protein KAT68_11905 [Bacteroidales bacterium]|nr:hypothetical protein [Bacteroidales bacterium]
MKNWAELQISIIFFAGIAIALLTSILVLVLLRQNIKNGLKKIAGKSNIIWTRSFKVTVILAGLLGAMSISFRSCEGNYDKLLESKYETVVKGFLQISKSYEYLTYILVFWFIIFSFYYLIIKKRRLEEN